MRLSSFILAMLFNILMSQAATITFSAMRPALVSVDPSIKSVAIINRTLAKQKKTDVIEGVLTGEGVDGDQKAIQRALSGLAEQLRSNRRFSVVHSTKALKGVEFAGKFPTALDWNTVRQLCKHYKVDALIVLESFDSDFIITNGRRDGESLRFFASGLAQIDLGFRFYDPLGETIADQYNFSFSDNFSSESGSIREALGGLINRSNAVSNISYQAGNTYAKRISPSWYKISREYFQKGKKSKDLARGARMMEANDWDAALESLKLAVETGHRKARGRAAHNIAVVYEILGELKLAKKWTSTAWGEYENKPSKDYAYRLTKRINQQVVVKEQYGNLN